MQLDRRRFVCSVALPEIHAVLTCYLHTSLAHAGCLMESVAPRYTSFSWASNKRKAPYYAFLGLEVVPQQRETTLRR